VMAPIAAPAAHRLRRATVAHRGMVQLAIATKDGFSGRGTARPSSRRCEPCPLS
jgi:hypothetical protein